jgi:hypothetical protein
VARTLNAAEFDMTCRRVQEHARALVPDAASEDELGRFPSTAGC